MKRLILTFSLLLHFVLLTQAQDLKKYDRGSFIKGQDTIAYRVLFPEHFNPAQKYPIVFFLHGRGESGNDNEKQLSNGAKTFLRNDYREQFPAIIVFPQCKADSYWANVDIKTDSLGKRSFHFIKGGKPTVAMHALLGMVDDFSGQAICRPQTGICGWTFYGWHGHL